MKDRADVVLYKEGYVESIRLAQSYIMQNLVLIEDKPIEKAGQQIEYNSNIRIKGKKHPYVSRGGLKIEKAIKDFSIDLDGKTCLDIGASTGGFTDCMLKFGASKIFAVDVGYGQLAWSLQSDDRVIVMDRTNIRNVKVDNLEGQVDFITADVSFISLKIVLPVIDELLKENGSGVILIKPQFEASKDEVGEKGIVREKATHVEVLKNIVCEIEENNFYIKNMTYSPITGATGNIEFLAEIIKTGQVNSFDIESLVDEAHAKFII